MFFPNKEQKGMSESEREERGRKLNAPGKLRSLKLKGVSRDYYISEEG